MQPADKTLPHSNVVSNDLMMKLRRQKALTKPRLCLTMALADDSSPLKQPKFAHLKLQEIEKILEDSTEHSYQVTKLPTNPSI